MHILLAPEQKANTADTILIPSIIRANNRELILHDVRIHSIHRPSLRHRLLYILSHRPFSATWPRSQDPVPHPSPCGT